MSQQYNMLLDALAALRNGIVYGVKVRAPHTLVNLCVWSNASWSDTFTKVRQMSIQHGMNLGMAACVFKVGTSLLSIASGGGAGSGENNKWHRALMAGICGFIFWGEANPVNIQVNMYVMSRTATALAVLFIERRVATAGSTPLTGTEKALFGPTGYRLFSTTVWAIALYLFFNHTNVLQGGLKQSMTQIYKDGDTHNGDIKALFWTGGTASTATAAAASGSSPSQQQRPRQETPASSTAASPMIPVEALPEAE